MLQIICIGDGFVQMCLVISLLLLQHDIHLFRMSMLAFAVRDNSVNRDLLMKICMVHDLAESVVGDITPYDGVTKEEKRVLEEVTH